jgi:hypothetical protein
VKPDPEASIICRYEICIGNRGGIEFIETDVVEYARPLVELVLEYRIQKDDKKRPDVSELFETEPGMILGDQIVGLQEMAFIGNFMSGILEFNEAIQKMLKGFADGELRKLVPEDASVPDPKELKELEEFEYFAKKYSMTEEEKDVDNLARIDPLWFVSLVTFAIYSYLEVYAVSILEMLEQYPKIIEKIDEYLQSREPSKGDKNPITSFHQLKQRGVKGKLRNIEEALSFDQTLIEMIGQEEYDFCWRGFKKFIYIRGKIAHRSPRLSPEEYTDAHFDRDLYDFQTDTAEFTKRLEKTVHMKQAFKEMNQHLQDVFRMYQKTDTVVMMATQYVALFDCILSANLELMQESHGVHDIGDD